VGGVFFFFLGVFFLGVFFFLFFFFLGEGVSGESKGRGRPQRHPRKRFASKKKRSKRGWKMGLNTGVAGDFPMQKKKEVRSTKRATIRTGVRPVNLQLKGGCKRKSTLIGKKGQHGFISSERKREVRRRTPECPRCSE